MRIGTVPLPPEIQPGEHLQQKPHVVLAEDEIANQAFTLALTVQRTLERLVRKAYNYANPIDEYADLPTGFSGRRDIQPDYDQVPERYESILWSLGIGTTTAVLTIGSSRNITLYSGAALTTQLVGSFQNVGIIAGPDDKRFIVTAGAATSAGHIALMGHCLERDGGDR
jgi:hypothetical protein